ncbi:rRNA maturation RNase YbeY [Amorphus orientalis]|uniref:Endoribonuclease YbeY n=1 Tax=Amorphus orientalis TaxID=649198 RepID=A0AAE3VRH7_9HYPH|nr:rRNA maturation RNase YbeY [Amorphus orientalis]MDQ0317027.1 putative rRNA maturation factor [Amorphus orientalis]
MSGKAGLLVDVIREADGWPDEPDLVRISEAAVAAACAVADLDVPEGAGIAVLFADDARVQSLNAGFRDKDRPTNVLSFPAPPDAMDDGAPHLGDVVLALETVTAEANAEGKPLDHHIAHLVMHGFLHIMGYDHMEEAEAEEMEQVESSALASLGIADPYAP